MIFTSKFTGGSPVFFRGMIGCLLAAVIGVLQNCASSPSVSGLNLDAHSPGYRFEARQGDKDAYQPPFEGRLPLGIGTRFDLFVADAAYGMSDFYHSYLEPLRKGKVFGRQPYALDYSILPKKGEAFQNKTSIIDSLSFKSDYKFQIGISRNFVRLSDFLNPNFWLAKGRFAVLPPPRKEEHSLLEEMQMDSLNNENQPIDLTGPAGVDLNQVLDDRWGLSSSEGQ